jgi:hypothetical protein
MLLKLGQLVLLGSETVTSSSLVAVTQSAMTSAVGSESVTASSLVNVTGVTATGAIGSPFVFADVTSCYNRSFYDRFYGRRKCLGINCSRSNSKFFKHNSFTNTKLDSNSGIRITTWQVHM